MKKVFKVFLAIVLVICLSVGGFFGYRFYKSKNDSSEDNTEDTSQSEDITKIEFVPVSEKDALSEAQWMALLNEAFEFTDYTEYSDDKIIGTYAVTTGFDRLGGACTEYYLDGKEKNDENIKALAIEKGVIEQNYLDSYIGQEQADELIANLKAIMQEDYHIEKNEVNLAADVVDGQAWSVDYYNHIENDEAENPFQDEVIATTGDYEPQIDDKIVYLDEYGIMHGGQIIAVQSTDDGKYDILTVPVETQEDLIDNYTVAGYVDWSRITNIENKEASNNSSFAMCDTSTENASGDISVDMVISGECNEEGIKIKSFKIDNRKILNPSDITDDEHENSDDKNNDSSDEKNTLDAKMSASGEFKITLEDVKIYVYVQDDEEAYFEVSFNPNVVLDGISVEAEIPLASFPVGLGVLSVDINPSLLVEADTGIEIKIGAANPVSISTRNNTIGGSVKTSENGVICDVDEEKINNIDLNADEFSVAGGAKLGFGVKLCEFIKVAEPNITMKMVAVGKQLEKVEGYETSCYELKVAGPLLEIKLTSEGTLVDYFLATTDFPSKWSPTDFNDDSTLLVSKYYHLEFSPIKVLNDENGNASVCTHYLNGENHSTDEKISFKYNDENEDTFDTSAKFICEVNDIKYGFEFVSEEYEKQYLNYLDTIPKEDIMKKKTFETQEAIEYVDYVDGLVYINIDNQNEYESFSNGDYYLNYGENDISKLKTIYAKSDGIYAHGTIVGRITSKDKHKYNSNTRKFKVGDIVTTRQPYRNMEYWK